MRNRISNELVAFTIIALLVLGNLFYLLAPGLGEGMQADVAVGDEQAVASLPETDAEAGPLLDKDSLRHINSAVSSGAGKGSMVLQSDFAVLFPADADLTAVEGRWNTVRQNYPEAMENLMPLARIEQDKETIDKKMTLHLAVGPFGNMQDAAYLCVSLQRKGETCRVSPFSGQPLDLFGHAALGEMTKDLKAAVARSPGS